MVNSILKNIVFFFQKLQKQQTRTLYDFFSNLHQNYSIYITFRG